MYQEGNIVYFDPFYFKNGNTAKPKYFIILKCIEKYNLVASLPTRKDSIPSTETVNHGCVELPNINLNCFVIYLEITHLQMRNSEWLNWGLMAPNPIKLWPSSRISIYC